MTGAILRTRWECDRFNRRLILTMNYPCSDWTLSSRKDDELHIKNTKYDMWAYFMRVDGVWSLDVARGLGDDDDLAPLLAKLNAHGFPPWD